MKVITIIFFIAITMALSLTLTMTNTYDDRENTSTTTTTTTTSSYSSGDEPFPLSEKIMMPSRRLSRFLVENSTNSRASQKCRKDHKECFLGDGYYNSKCCSGKCIDVVYDPLNCGACRRKCQYTETCCGGKCVDLAYDKRNCGQCGNRCDDGLVCIYGMCDYP